VIFPRTILIFIFLLVCTTGFAQYTGNSRIRHITLRGDTVQLDSLSIIPGSMLITNSYAIPLDTTFYRINYGEGKVIIHRKKLPETFNTDSLRFSYKTFPYLFSSETKHKDINRIRTDIQGRKDPFSYNFENKSDDLFKMEGLNKSGSISRGISFGNNQNLVVNSNLNLQLSGHLTNNVDILLAATDNNIPIQPDGNTQQLQEFDKVFIQFSNVNTKLIAGDFQLMRPSGYFMNFYKKSQGISFSTIRKILPDKITDTSKAGFYKTSLSVAVSRGKFARNQIQGVESNQGPYRLIGAEKELFIIVLSGTEKIYIDGRLLNRGQENDYVIDYNTAEVTFTAKQLITKDKRIVAEFQYSDKNYTRSLVHFSNDYEKEKLKVHLHAYSEQDSKNQPLQQDLSTEQKKLLYRIGDTLTLAVSPSIDSIAWNSKEVLYKKVDTIIGTKKYTPVYIYNTDSTKASYRLAFSNVGAGNGNYKQISSSANGKVFQWVMPDSITGNRMGNFEPVLQLITPKKKQMLTAGLEYAFRKNTNLVIETAVSNNDLNTFSAANSTDDMGYALKMNFNDLSPLTKNTIHTDKDTSTSELLLFSNINYEYVQKYFSPVERYRSIEFERDWNRSTLNVLNDQHIAGAGIGLSKRNIGSIGYRFNAFLEGNNYNANKHFANFNINRKLTSVFYDASFLRSKSASNTNFYRHKSGVSQKIKFFTIGLKDEFEQNKFSSTPVLKDSLLSNSYKFWEWQAFVQNSDTTKNRYGLNYKQRTDYAVKSGMASKLLNRSAFAESYGGYFEWLKNPNNQFKVNATYRKLQILDSTLTIQKPDNSLVTRVEYNLRVLKGLIYSNTYYEIGSGLEVKKEFSYLEVAAGQGVYTWIDYDSNGVKELNEFEVSRFSDKATYIKVYTPTNDYVKIFSNQFSQTFMLKPSAVWADKKGIRKFISLFANQASYRVDRKSTETDFKKAYNPFLTETNSTTLAALNSSFRNTFFINQLSPVFSVDLNYQDVRIKTLLVNGFDQLMNIYKQAQLRWNMTQQVSFNMDYKEGRKSSASQYFTMRDYSIKYYEAEPKFNYQPNTSFRTTVSFKYTDRKNNVFINKDSLKTLRGGETAFLADYGMEIKYNVLDKGSFNLKANFIKIKFNGLENSSIGFEMLDGLKTGKNLTWGISYQRTLSNNLQLSLTYDGRKSSNNKAIHTGGAQVRAYF
jgi:hypothetical protein